MNELLRRLRFVLHREQFEQELEEEMQHHRAMQGGVSGRFGNVALLKEESRAMWSWNFLEQLSQDIRYAFRAMASNRLFTAMAVLSLALGIGANTAIYSFMEAILLRSLPVQNPQELAILRWSSIGNSPVIHGAMGSMNRDPKTGARTSPNFPYASFETLRAKTDVFSNLFAYASAWQINVVAQRQAVASSGLFVSGGFYNGLGVLPAAGRLISDEDDRAGAPPVTVLTYKFWERHFAANPNAVGQSILINNVPFTVIGVSAPGFFGVEAGTQPSVTIPLRQAPLIDQHPSEDEKRRFFNRNFYWLEMMGRLRPGVTLQQAQAALATQFHAYVESTAANEKEKKNFPWLWLQEGGSGIDSLRRQYSESLYVLMGMVGLILLIACANIANLLLARATARRREIAVRLSLGAGRWRVVRQLLTESVLLSVLGGVLGLAVAYCGIQSITWLLANGAEDFTLRAALNWQVLGFTLGLALVTGIVFGLAPALQATRIDVNPALKEAKGSAARGGLRIWGLHLGVNQLLVAGQIAMSLLLVIAAGLFMHTVANLRSVQLGFNQNNILIFSVNARQVGLKDAALVRFYSGLQEHFRTIPGVKSVGVSQIPLVSHYVTSTNITVPGLQLPAGEDAETDFMRVNASFLSTMEIPILLGRGIEERDMALGRVAVINEKLAAKYFGKENPVGRMIGLDSHGPVNIEIIGVAKTAHYNSVKEKEFPTVLYVPYTQNTDDLGGMFFELRTERDPLSAIGAVRQIVSQANSSVPVTEVSTQSSRIDKTISRQRTFASLCAGFAVLALLIACVGLYGTMAYAVERRTNEIGIRMALGARSGNVQWMVLREVLALSTAGLAIGLLAAWQTTRFVESFLFGMKPNDPATILLSVAMLAIAGLLAGYIPALRASRIEPMVALRNE